MPNRRNSVYLVIIILLLTGLFTGRAFLFNIAGLLGGAVLVSFLWAWLSMQGIVISRRTRTNRAHVGTIFDEHFMVQNRAFLPKLWLEVRDESTLPGYRASHVVSWLNPRASYRWYADAVCHTRGDYTLGPMRILTGDPFGMFLLSQRINSTSRLTVYPLIVPLTKLALPAGSLIGNESSRRRTPFVTTDAAGIREYLPGDEFNRIHWRSTAKRGELMVREYEAEPRLDVWIFVDFAASSLIEFPGLRRTGTNGTGAVLSTTGVIAPSSEEYAVVLAASLSQHFIDQRRAIGFAAYLPDRFVLSPERGSRQIGRILDALARANSTGETPLSELLRLESPQVTRGSTVLIITTASEDIRWISQAHILMRRGLRLVCLLLDSASFGAAHPAHPMLNALASSRIPTTLIRYGDDIARTLAIPPVV
jgi:uncharacterized protein (DUF58 family)